MQDQVLIVDDEPLVCESLDELIKRNGYKTYKAYNGHEALEFIKKEIPSVIITDINMPKLDGMQLLLKTKDIAPEVPVIIITGYGTIQTAVEAMKHGAYDFIMKPFSNSDIGEIIRKAISSQNKNKINIAEKFISHHNPKHGIITEDPEMLEIMKKVRRIAQTDSTVLIQGESGTGKELIARAIHRLSHRSDGAYVAVNCAALPEGLIESELFGHERGSFTGAVARRIGKFELAHGGTLLLDEVSEMDIPFQAKLLRALQEREIVRVGGTQSIGVDVRVVATTNKDLIKEVEKGNFREDLFYRLCVVPIFLPPLREREDDIPILAQYFINKFCSKVGIKHKDISQDAVGFLKEHTWPGNVRELENTIERALSLAESESIKPDDLLLTKRKKPSRYISLKLGTSIYDAEKELILRTLEYSGGNKQKTSEILGITSKTIRSKLHQYKEK
ncbi:response regulator [Candidatus Poribacteria bacterium]|nr:response regulator [Candidatus Poribacteria bacterium]